MHKKLFLLEWKPCQSRVWAGWMALWLTISFLMLSALLMTDHLLNKVILPPTWLLIWFSPMLGFLIKVRVVETQHFLEHDLCVAGFSFYRWKRLVSPGLWSVDCINGRFRLNRITQVGKTIHYPWRLHYNPLFMSPIEHKSHAVKAVSK